MPREKKDYRNFGCKLDTTTFNRLNDFCEMSGQNKTFVVERAIQMFLNENYEKVKQFNEDIGMTPRK